MQEVIQQLQKQMEEYQRVISQAQRFLAGASEGKLRIIHNKKTIQYYHRKDAYDSQGTYLKKEQMNLIKELAQKNYAEKIVKTAQNNIRSIQEFLAQYTVNGISDVYENLGIERKELVHPYMLPQDEFAKLWEQQTYIKDEKYILDESSGIYTERGELVRSKSEKILADKLHIMKIPYHYEKPLYLSGYGTIYPDFTVLNKRTRKEYYWEHLGLMDNPEYCEKAIKKIECYERNNIFSGDGLILTYETREHPINTKSIKIQVNRYLL